MGETVAGCEWRTDPDSRYAEARQGNWLVCEGIRDRAGLDEPYQYRRNAVTRGIRCMLRIGSQAWSARDGLRDCRHGSEEMSRWSRGICLAQAKMVGSRCL